MYATDTKNPLYSDFLTSWMFLTSKSAEQTDYLSTSTFKVKYLGYGVTHIYSNVMGHFSTGVILPHVWHEKNIPWWRKKFLHLRSHYSTSKFDPPRSLLYGGHYSSIHCKLIDRPLCGIITAPLSILSLQLI